MANEANAIPRVANTAVIDVNEFGPTEFLYRAIRYPIEGFILMQAMDSMNIFVIGKAPFNSSIRDIAWLNDFERGVAVGYGLLLAESILHTLKQELLFNPSLISDLSVKTFRDPFKVKLVRSKDSAAVTLEVIRGVEDSDDDESSSDDEFDDENEEFIPPALEQMERREPMEPTINPVTQTLNVQVFDLDRNFYRVIDPLPIESFIVTPVGDILYAVGRANLDEVSRDIVGLTDIEKNIAVAIGMTPYEKMLSDLRQEFFFNASLMSKLVSALE